MKSAPAADGSADHRVVIVGAGQAGGETATALRLAGFTGRITLVGDEAQPPYSRPPLSKAFLDGAMDVEDLLLRPEQIYLDHDIDLRTGTCVDNIDRSAKVAHLLDGDALPYDSLVLATGGRARHLAGHGLETTPNALNLRSLDDACALRDCLRPGQRIVIVGGGYIGLEIAAAAREHQAEVIVLEVAPRVLSRVASTMVSDYVQQAQRGRGVEIRVDVSIRGFEFEDGRVTAVKVGDGEVIPVDTLLVGVGLEPSVELAEAAGLEVGDGVVVDEFLRTSDPAIFAIGDVANFPVPGSGMRRRIESVPNATEHARCVAATILGDPREHRAIPWFWSDQFDFKLQMVGHSVATDEAIGRVSDGGLAVFHLREGTLVAVEVVNSPSDFAFAKRLVAAQIQPDRTQLADPTVPLKALVPKRTVVVG